MKSAFTVFIAAGANLFLVACKGSSSVDPTDGATPASESGDERLSLGPTRDAESDAIEGATFRGDAAPTARTSLASPLSFLFITVDTLRPDLGYAGYERPVSPHLDRLAQESAIYEGAYSISTYTAFSLPPMMASRYPSEMPRSDRHEVRYMGQNTLLAERLHAAGYRTAGAASHFLFNRALGWIDGFDRFVMTGVEGSQGMGIDWRHSSRPIADTAIRFLEEPAFVAGPFFMWIHFLDPHKQYLEHPGFPSFGNDPRALYDGEIAFTDHHIGRVLDALAASPAADRTVIVFTGDHGEAFGEHGFYFHGREIWNEVVRVPLLIRVPGAKPRRVSRRTSNVDLAPTVLDLAGVPADDGARGQSLVPEILGGEVAHRPIMVDQPRNPYYPPRRAFIDGAYKLQHFIDLETYKLFDLDHDPGETTDLAETQPDTLQSVKSAYEAYTSKIVDFIPTSTMPVADPHKPTLPTADPHKPTVPATDPHKPTVPAGDPHKPKK